MEKPRLAVAYSHFLAVFLAIVHLLSSQSTSLAKYRFQVAPTILFNWCMCYRHTTKINSWTLFCVISGYIHTPQQLEERARLEVRRLVLDRTRPPERERPTCGGTQSSLFFVDINFNPAGVPFFVTQLMSRDDHDDKIVWCLIEKKIFGPDLTGL